MPYLSYGTYHPTDFHVDPRAWPNLHKIAQYMIQNRHMSKDHPARVSDIAKGCGVSRPQVAKLLKDRVGFTKIDSTEGATYGYYYWPEFKQQSLSENNPGYPRQVRLLTHSEHPPRYVYEPVPGLTMHGSSEGAPVTSGAGEPITLGSKWVAVEGVSDETLTNLWKVGNVNVRWDLENRDSLNSVIQQLITLAEWADKNGH